MCVVFVYVSVLCGIEWEARRERSVAHAVSTSCCLKYTDKGCYCVFYYFRVAQTDSPNKYKCFRPTPSTTERTNRSACVNKNMFWCFSWILACGEISLRLRVLRSLAANRTLFFLAFRFCFLQIIFVLTSRHTKFFFWKKTERRFNTLEIHFWQVSFRFIHLNLFWKNKTFDEKLIRGVQLYSFRQNEEKFLGRFWIACRITVDILGYLPHVVYSVAVEQENTH